MLSPCGPLKLLLKVVSSDKDGKTGDQLSGLLYTAGDGEDTMEQFYGGGEDNHGNENTSHAGKKAVSNVQLSEMPSGNSNHGAPEKVIELWWTIRKPPCLEPLLLRIITATPSLKNPVQCA